MKKFSVLAICLLFAACAETHTTFDSSRIYLSPPPDVLYDAAIIIVKDMGFTMSSDPELKPIRAGDRNPYYTIFSTNLPATVDYSAFAAEKKDETSGGIITVHFFFKREGVDTQTKIWLTHSQLKANLSNLEKIHDEIVSRLREKK